MKQSILLVISLLIVAVASGQTYRGTMTFGSYTQRGVEAVLTVEGKSASLLMKQVKFSRMMPVKVDVTFESIEITDSTIADGMKTLTLRGENIVPTTKKGRWEKYTVTGGHGTAGRTCHFECMIGERKVTFNGTRQ